MQLQQLQQQLTKQLDGLIVHTDCWCLPIHTVNISYQPILKTKMDILMKMLLISFQQAQFKTAKQLSDILLVEELFIRDLMMKMKKTGLIEQVDECYQLTDQGIRQFKDGVYEEQLELKEIELQFSIIHQSFIEADLDELDFEDFPDTVYRYYDETKPFEIADTQIIKHLTTLLDDNEEANQPVISSIQSTETVQINDIPCIEFVTYEEKENKIYIRVWNTLQQNWDQTLEKELTEHEQQLWSEKVSSSL